MRATDEDNARPKQDAVQVYLPLKHLLINHRFRPGEQLHPRELADQLKVSSTPIREALQRLDAEHLLRFTPNKGFFANVLDADEMRDASILAFALLQFSVSAYLQTADYYKLPACFLGHVGDQKSSVDSAPAFAALMEKLNLSIARLSQNGSLLWAISNLNDRTHYIRVIEFEDAPRRFEAVRERRDLIESITSRNARKALDGLQKQLQSKLRLIPDLVKEGLARGYLRPLREAPSIHAAAPGSSAHPDSVAPPFSGNIPVVGAEQPC